VHVVFGLGFCCGVSVDVVSCFISFIDVESCWDVVLCVFLDEYGVLCLILVWCGKCFVVFDCVV